MSLGLTIAKNTVYLALGKTISTGMGVATVALLLRYFTPDDYGRYTTVIAFVLLFGTLTDLGLNLTTTQDISLPNAHIARTLSSVFTARVLINIGLILLLPLILYAFPYDASMRTAIMIASIMFFSTSLFQVLSSYFQKTLQAGKVAFAENVGRLVLLAATLIAIRLNMSFVEIMVPVSLGACMQLLVLLYLTRREIPLRFFIDRETIMRILKKTWPIALSVVFTTIYFKGDAVILSLARPFEDVGIYGAAYKILEVLIALPILFMGLILPHLSHSYAQKNSAQFNALIQKSWDALALVTIPMVGGVLLLANNIILFIAGEQYAPAAGVLRILIVALGIIFFGSLFTHAIVAVNKQRAMVKYYAAVALGAVILYVLYIPTYTYYAAAAVTVLAECAIAVVAFLKVRASVRFTLEHAVLIKSIIATLGMCATLYFLTALPLLARIGGGILTYGALLIAVRALPKEWVRFNAL